MRGKPLAEQVMVITGASSGIGLVTAREAARRGAKVVLAARNAPELEQAANQIRREGGHALAVPTDVTDYDQVEALARRAAAVFGRIDTWVNNAAVGLYARFEDTSLEDFRRLMDTDFMGQVHGAKAALPYLRSTHGALICVGSVVSDRGLPLQGAYSAAKAALKGWLDSFRVELMREGSPIRVTLVKPASINTPLFNKARTRIGVMPRPVPPVYQPELVAETILRAAEGDERDAYVGGMGKFLSLMERMSPRLVDLQMLHMGYEGQMTDRTKSEAAPDNVHAPMDRDGGEHGDFGEEAREVSLYQSLANHPAATPLAAAALLGTGALLLSRRSDNQVLPSLLTLGAMAMLGQAGMTTTRTLAEKAAVIQGFREEGAPLREHAPTA